MRIVLKYAQRSTFFIVLIAVTISQAIAQSQSLTVSTLEEIGQDLKMVPCNNADRLDAVEKLFQKMGATEADMSVEKLKDVQNVVVTKKGRTDEMIIVGAHYDKVYDGCGAIDNWTGIVIIANVYRTFRNVETSKTIKFVAFDKEEQGLVGSRAMVRAITKEKRPLYCSMVNVDSFGFGYPQVLDNTSSAKMTAAAKALAAEMKLQLNTASLAGTADADSSSFIDKGIPAITFHGLSKDWQRYLHSSNDQLENVKPASVHLGYRFLLPYISKIDAGGCDDYKK
jgi:Zn-dependent M28 family amino/carboxypeptidase